MGLTAPCVRQRPRQLPRLGPGVWSAIFNLSGDSTNQELAPWAGVKFVMLLIFPNLQRASRSTRKPTLPANDPATRERALQCEGFSF